MPKKSSSANHKHKTPVSGLQTLPDKRGKVKNCTPGRSFPCGKACLGLGSAILESCLKKLKPESASKAENLAKAMNGSGTSGASVASNDPVKPVAVRVQEFRDRQQQFTDLLSGDIRSKISSSQLSDTDKQQVIATATDLINEQYDIISKHGVEAFNRPLIEISDNPQHNILPPPQKPIIDLIAYTNSITGDIVLRDADLAISAPGNKDLETKVNAIIEQFKKVPTTTFAGTESYKDAIDRISKITNTTPERSREMLESVNRFTGGNYTKIRNAEKNKQGEFGQQDEQDAANINEFLTKFKPKYEGTVYRGMAIPKKVKAQIINQLRNGTFIHDAMSSYSSDETTARGFSYPIDSKDYGIILVSKSKSGVSVRNISRVSNEDEVLIPKGTKIKMTGEPYEKNDRIYIPVEEID